MNIPSINNNTTPIDMLPYLDDIESNKQGMHSSQPDIKKIQNKFNDEDFILTDLNGYFIK